MTRVSTLSIAVTSLLVFGVSFAVLSPSAAQAACSRWDVSGDWHFVQTNGYSPRFTLRQTETGIQGDAFYAVTAEPSGPPGFQTGNEPLTAKASVDGALNGDSFKVTAYWDDGTTGIYTGTIGPQGRIEGSTYDAQHPQSMANWHSDRTAKCLTSAGGTSAGGVSPSSTTPPIVGGSAPANSDALCTEYAATAVKQSNENVAMRCGFAGPRWDSNAANHLNWCRAVDPALQVSENAARTQDLERCREMAQKAEDLGVVRELPGGTGNVFKQMKP
jgi:hypothetical protein